MNNEGLENKNVFMPTETVLLPDMNIMEEFVKTFYFNYLGNGEIVIAKLSGNPSTTGIQADKVVHEPSGLYSVRVYGAPRRINKNILNLRLTDDKENRADFPLEFQVFGLEIEDANLPDAIGLFKPYSTKIYFTNPTSEKPKFFYNFPVEFGKVVTNEEDGANFTTISFTPSKPGKYKFLLEALCESDSTDPEGKEVLLGRRTMHVKVLEKSEPTNRRLDTVKSLKMVRS
jgi:hypothetical protein